MKKDVFISYANKDKNKVDILENLLKGNLFFNAVVIANSRQPQKSLAEKVKKGIQKSEYIIPILTENSINTQWINQEIGYAEAKDKKIIAIIQKDIVKKLKGFIHDKNDLPYQFSGKTERSKNIFFKKQAIFLIKDLETKVDKPAINYNLQNFFKGNWQLTWYTLNGDKIGSEQFKIKEGNKYFVEKEYCYNIKDIDFNTENKKLKFTKVGIRKYDTRIMKNDLIIVSSGKIEGFEEEYKDDKLVKKQKLVYVNMALWEL